MDMNRHVTVSEWLSLTAVCLSLVALVMTCCGCESDSSDAIRADRPEVAAAAADCLAVIRDRYGVEPSVSVRVYEIPVEEQNAKGQGHYPHQDSSVATQGEWAYGWSIESTGEAWVSYPADTKYRHVLMHELQHLCGIDADDRGTLSRLAADTGATK